MENQDWLHMFGSAIAHYGMDMNAIFRYTTSTDDKSAHGQTTAEQYLKEMRARFGDQGLTWQDMGDYALFLSALHDAGVRAQQGAQESY